MGTVQIIETQAQKILFEYATKRGDAFRQWFYPGLPRSYKVNPEVKTLIHAGMLRGLSAQQIADEIYNEKSF